MQSPCTSSLNLGARLALPDADGNPLDVVLAAEVAEVLGLLGQLVVPGALPQVSSVSGSVLANNADFLRSFGL